MYDNKVVFKCFGILSSNRHSFCVQNSRPSSSHFEPFFQVLTHRKKPEANCNQLYNQLFSFSEVLFLGMQLKSLFFPGCVVNVSSAAKIAFYCFVQITGLFVRSAAAQFFRHLRFPTKSNTQKDVHYKSMPRFLFAAWSLNMIPTWAHITLNRSENCIDQLHPHHDSCILQTS